MEFNLANIVLWGIIVIFIYLEGQHRVHKDGKGEANKALIGGALVLIAGLFLQNRFGIAGLYALILVLLVIALIYPISLLLGYPRKSIAPAHNHLPHEKTRD